MFALLINFNGIYLHIHIEPYTKNTTIWMYMALFFRW